MEEIISEHVNSLYDQVKESKSMWLTCDCKNCRMDTICYALNRIPPHYVSGGRGVTHNSNYIKENSQITVDIDKLCIEGMRLVNSAKRPNHDGVKKNAFIDMHASVAEFNFPTFTGNVFDGQTFEPLADAIIVLKLNGEKVEMMDQTWPNPCMTYNATKGSYSFWLAPQEAVSEGMNKKFNFSVEVQKDGYEPVTYLFTIPLTSEKHSVRELDSTYSVKIKDIFLFKEGE